MAANQRERMLLAAAIVCVVLLLGNMLVIQPLTAAYDANQAEIVRLERDLAEGRSLRRNAPIMQRQWNEMTSRTLAANNTQAADDVLKALERWDSQSGFDRTSVAPRWSSVDRQHDELEIRITGNGSMNEIARFLYHIEADLLPVRLDDVIISATSDPRRLSLTAILSGLQLKLDPNGQLPAARGRGGRGAAAAAR